MKTVAEKSEEKLLVASQMIARRFALNTYFVRHWIIKNGWQGRYYELLGMDRKTLLDNLLLNPQPGAEK